MLGFVALGFCGTEPRERKVACVDSRMGESCLYCAETYSGVEVSVHITSVNGYVCC